VRLRVLFSSLAFVLVSACTKVQMYEGEELPVDEKAIMFFQSNGDDFIGRYGFKLVAVDGEKVYVLSKKLEFKPGVHELEFSVWSQGGYEAAFAGAVVGYKLGGNAGIAVGATTATIANAATISPDGKSKITLDFKAGYLYLIKFKENERNEVYLYVEEI